MSDLKVWKTFFNDVDKEEAWLNEMAAKGLSFEPSGKLGPPRYDFSESEPGEWIYRVEFLAAPPNNPAGRRYLEFMEDAGVETVFENGTKAYFRKRAADGPFDLYSDLDSRIAHYRRVRKFLIWAAVSLVPSTAALAIELIVPQIDPLLTGLVIAVLILTVPSVGLLAAQLVRESRRIKALVARRGVFE